MSMFPLNPVLYQRGASGVPSTATLLRDVRGVMTRYEHTISVTGGFESCTIEIDGTYADAVYWMGQLMASCVVYSPGGEIVWEGYLTGVAGTFGQEEVDLSLDDLANAVNVYYTPPPPAAWNNVGFSISATSISAYGRKEFVFRGSNMLDFQAFGIRNKELAQRAYPLARRSSTVATGDMGHVSITLSFAGWYTTLDWLTTTSTTAATTTSDAVVTSLITTYNATNNFIASTSFSATGVTSTQQIPAQTTYRAAIENLLAAGTAGNQRYAWGVYEGRVFKGNTWAGATPTTITYVRPIGDGRVYTSTGTWVPWWDVRPDAMYQVPEFVDYLPSPISDSASRYYVERVTCSVTSGGASLRLEPAKSTELDALIARVR